jgi:hypothetical protein
MADELKERKYYPSDVVSVLDAMEIGNLQLMGSSALRSSQYSADYDGYDKVRGSLSAMDAARRFRRMILKLDKRKDLWITEIKAGMKDGKKIVWTVDEIRGDLKGLAAAIPTGLVKVDVVAITAGNRFTEFTVIYDFGYEERKTDKAILEDLKEDREEYLREKNFIKVLKRDFAIAKFSGLSLRIKKLTEILNSDIGRLYQLVTDLDVLLGLLEEGERLPRAVVDTEIEQFIHRLGSIYKLSGVLQSETSLVKKLQSSISERNLTRRVTSLKSVREKLNTILQNAAKKEL